MTGLIQDSLPEINAEGRAKVRLAGRELCITSAFLEDIAAQNLRRHVAVLDRALLVMHSPVDAVVAVSHAAQLFMAAQHPKSFIALDDADHLLTAPADADRAARLIAAWAAKYLSPG